MTGKSISRGLNFKQPGLGYYVDKIVRAEPFSFVRYGDGEWSAAILHDRSRTGSGSQNLSLPALQKGVARTLTEIHRNDNYIVAFRPNSVIQRPTVREWLIKNIPSAIKWHDCRVFAHASMRGQLLPLVQALRSLTIPLIFIGPPWLIKLREKYRIFPKAQFIEVTPIDCYHNAAGVLGRIRAVGRPAFYSFSAGPSTKIWIHHLFTELGQSSFMIDFGSLWDIYADVQSRQYQKRITPAIRKANLGQ